MEFQSQTQIITAIHDELQRKLLGKVEVDHTQCFKERENEWEMEVERVIAEQIRLDSIKKELQRKRRECELKRDEALTVYPQEIGEHDRMNRKLVTMKQEMDTLKMDRERSKEEQRAMINLKQQMLSIS